MLRPIHSRRRRRRRMSIDLCARTHGCLLCRCARVSVSIPAALYLSEPDKGITSAGHTIAPGQIHLQPHTTNTRIGRDTHKQHALAGAHTREIIVLLAFGKRNDAVQLLDVARFSPFLHLHAACVLCEARVWDWDQKIC